MPLQRLPTAPSSRSILPPYLEIFAISLAGIVLEISYTRIFSFKLYYYFTYLIVGIAMLGLGAGGVLVATVPRLRHAAADRLIPACCLLGSVAVFAGYFVIALTQLNPSELHVSLGQVARLCVICVVLFSPFLMIGIVIAAIFAAYPRELNRLYCADLVGAGLGCALTVPLLYTVTPPGCVMLSAALLAMACLRTAALGSRGLLPLGVVIAAVLLGAAVVPARLPDPIPERTKTLGDLAMPRSAIRFSRWNPVFRIDVIDAPFVEEDQGYVVVHDGNMGSGLHRFDGDPATLARFDKDTRAFPFEVAIGEPRVLIIGSAGGHEVLASLHFKAQHVTGVELNPVTLSLLTDTFADYTGHLAENPRVSLVNAEGRSLLNREGATYDLIWFVAPDSYAAMNASSSGAFVLSESYLYTTEMLSETFDHLGPGGIVCAQFGESSFDQKPNRTTRYLATAREAMRRRGIDDFDRHVLVVTTPSLLHLSTVLLKTTPFTDEEIARFLKKVGAVPASRAVHAHGHDLDHGPVHQVITLPDAALPAWFATYPYLVTPVTDDSPFFWHFARFRDAIKSARSRGVQLDTEDSTGERVLLVLLVFAIVFAATWLFTPFVLMRGTWRAIPHKAAAGLYFAALGLGFMFFEVSLIQMLTLFVGYPTYSLSVTLFSLLVATGIGSLVSARYSRGSSTLAVLFVALVGLALFYRVAWPHLVDSLVGLPLEIRIVVAVLVIAPLGFCLGAFMPFGLERLAAIGPHGPEFVAWAWAVNGFASVTSSILSTILAMVVGFDTLLAMAVLVYLTAIVTLARIPQRAP